MVDCFSCVFLHGQVVTAIVESGKNMSAEQKKTERCPLLYEWHKKQYIGAAHGMAGIYYMLMQVSCVLFVISFLNSLCSVKPQISLGLF